MKAIFLKYRTIIIITVLVIAVLVGMYNWGGNYPKSDAVGSGDAYHETATSEVSSSSELSSSRQQDDKIIIAEAEESESIPDDTSTGTENTTDDTSISDGLVSDITPDPAPDGSSEGVYEGSDEYSESQGMNFDPETGKDQYLTDPVPEGKPIPVEPENAVITSNKLTCTLSVRCDTILDNMDLLDEEKWELVPEDGVILTPTKVVFYDGESVFNVLQREMKKNQIHMEFVNTPMYNSAYIEGINNLYEFDVGELSGWMYKVNGWFPNYGCSRYQLKDGDIIEWVYTCDLGKDVGGYYAVGSE